MKLDLPFPPRRGYVTEPTPLERLSNLEDALDCKSRNIQVYCKRDDLLPGMAGGNKTRKLDFCLQAALDQNSDTIITCGAVQSNHCRLTAAYCKKENLG